MLGIAHVARTDMSWLVASSCRAGSCHNLNRLDASDFSSFLLSLHTPPRYSPYTKADSWKTM